MHTCMELSGSQPLGIVNFHHTYIIRFSLVQHLVHLLLIPLKSNFCLPLTHIRLDRKGFSSVIEACFVLRKQCQLIQSSSCSYVWADGWGHRFLCQSIRFKILKKAIIGCFQIKKSLSTHKVTCQVFWMGSLLLLRTICQTSDKAFVLVQNNLEQDSH